MNEKITAALKNIYLILDVSAVYAAIFKRQISTSEEETRAHTTTTERSYIQGEREEERNTERHFGGDREKEIEETRTPTNLNTLVEAHEEAHAR